MLQELTLNLTPYKSLPAYFIPWRSVPAMPPAIKPLKLPCNLQGRTTSAYDTAIRMPYPVAMMRGAAGDPVGFLMSPDHDVFCLDFDNVRDPRTGDVVPWALSIINKFPDAMIEISVSGEGLHLWGRCDKSRLTRKPKDAFVNGGMKVEFFHSHQFVALGAYVRGNPDIDWTDVLDTEIADEANTTVNTVFGQPTGLSDHDVLDKMFGGPGSINVQFGSKAHPKQLWEGDPETLSGFFPPSEDAKVFDASKADMALACHLTFYCGNNPEQIERLMRQSGLARPKWDTGAGKNHLAKHTIKAALESVQKYWTHKAEEKAEQIAAQIASGEIMTTQDQRETHFRRCIYVGSHNAVLTPTGALMKQPEFRARYGGHKFLMSQDGTDPTKNAWEAFTENRVNKYPTADRLTFRPDLPYQALVTDPDGKIAVNFHRPRDVRRVSGDSGPFLRLIAKMIPDERDQAILLSYMAAVCQYPGRKFLWAPVVQGAQGNGKSTLISVLQYCVDGVVQGVNDEDAQYVTTMTAKDIDDRFNGNMANKTLAVIHEMHTDSFKDQRERQDHLKSLVTEATMMIEDKGMSKYQARNIVNFFFCSNHRDAVRLESSERRFAVFYTAQQTATDILAYGMTPQWFQDLWAWLRTDGFAIVYDYLMDFDIPADFNPAGGASRAPHTSSHAAAVEESRSPIERLLMDAVQGQESGFRDGWVSTRAVANYAEAEGIKKPASKTLSTALRAMGYVRVGQLRNMMQEGGKTTTVWSSNTSLESDKNWLTPYEKQEFMKAQGYPETPVI